MNYKSKYVQIFGRMSDELESNIDWGHRSLKVSL